MLAEAGRGELDLGQPGSLFKPSDTQLPEPTLHRPSGSQRHTQGTQPTGTHACAHQHPVHGYTITHTHTYTHQPHCITYTTRPHSSHIITNASTVAHTTHTITHAHTPFTRLHTHKRTYDLNTQRPVIIDETITQVDQPHTQNVYMSPPRDQSRL